MKPLSFVLACFVISLGAVHLVGQSAPVRQSAYLKASNPGMADHFGEGGALPGHTGLGMAISRDGNTIAVGAPHESSSARGINGNENDDSAYNAGAVYVFTRSGAQWTRQAYIKASNTGAGDYFGSSVALRRHGNALSVGRQQRRQLRDGRRQPSRQRGARRRGRLRLHPQRHDLDAASVLESVEHGPGGHQRRGPG